MLGETGGGDGAERFTCPAVAVKTKLEKMLTSKQT